MGEHILCWTRLMQEMQSYLNIISLTFIILLLVLLLLFVLLLCKKN